MLFSLITEAFTWKETGIIHYQENEDNGRKMDDLGGRIWYKTKGGGREMVLSRITKDQAMGQTTGSNKRVTKSHGNSWRFEGRVPTYQRPRKRKSQVLMCKLNSNICSAKSTI